MRAVRNGTYRGRTRISGGKTGSAQIDGQDETNWFIGFIDDSKLPFAVCVVRMQAAAALQLPHRANCFTHDRTLNVNRHMQVLD